MSTTSSRNSRLAFRAQIPRPELVDLRSTAGNQQYAGAVMHRGLFAMHCMGCNRHRSPEGSRVHKVLGRICGECVEARAARKLAKLGVSV